MSRQSGFSITKPVSVWNTPLKANFKDLFKALGKAVVDGSTGQWGSAVKDMVEAAGAVGLETDYTQIAWLLIYNAITQAMFTLVDEQKGCLLDPPEQEALKLLCEDLGWSLEQSEVCIDRSVFECPKKLPVVEAIRATLLNWFTKGFGMNEAQAQLITAQFSSKFVFALKNQWQSYHEKYAVLEGIIKTPFDKACEREQSWLNYKAWLKEQTNKKIFGETFSLKELYIPVRAYYERTVENNYNEGFGRERREEKERIAVKLEDELQSWLKAEEPHDAIRMIIGGPGSGKSSFTQMFAAHLIEQLNLSVLFIPLDQFTFSRDLVYDVGQFIHYVPSLDHNPLDLQNGEPQLLIIFDGLDELDRQGQVGTDTAQQFVRNVKKQVKNFNMSGTQLQVLISSRELAVQTSMYEFRKTEQILYLLPYVLTKEEQKKYFDHNGYLKEDQRRQWWKNYGKASGKGYSDMPEVLRGEELREITRQPLLNYLVALSYTDDTDRKIDFSSTTNLNQIYRYLLKAVYNRRWAKDRHAAVKDLSEDDFIRILEEIALAVWHSNKRMTTVQKVKEQLCDRNGLTSPLKIDKDGISQKISQIFLAFYFRQSGRLQSGEDTFEFTHKNFGDYLTARRIVRTMKRMYDRLHLQQQQEGINIGFDEQRELLHLWANTCGPTRLDEYLLEFIRNEIRLQSRETVKQWQQTLCRLFGFMLRYGMPMECLELPTYREETLWARNAEEALLALLNSCARVTKVPSHIEWSPLTAFGEWIAYIQGQRNGKENVLALRCLSFLDLQNCILYLRDFFNADFFKANLQGAQLQGAQLQEAKLRGAQLQGAQLQEAKLRGAQLQGAQLQGAQLQRAQLQRAQLQRAQLEGAQLQGAQLQRAQLQRAQLQKAQLEGAQLQGAQLQEAQLQRAQLQKAQLQKAQLQKANLYMADLRQTQLQKSQLKESQLRGTQLQGADLREADLQEANLQWAQLQEAQLQWAQLQKAHLQEAQFQLTELRGADLQGAQLRRSNFQGAKLQGAKLRGVDLRGVQLQGAQLQKADLQEVQLQGGQLQGIKLQGAQLQKAQLQGADLRGADLRDANLQGANLQGADLQGANLQGVKFEVPLPRTRSISKNDEKTTWIDGEQYDQEEMTAVIAAYMRESEQQS